MSSEERSPAAGTESMAASPSLSDLVAQLRRAMRRAARANHEAPALSVAQLELLTAIGAQPRIRPGDVALALRLAPNSVSTLASGLEAAGLLTRAPGLRDRRTIEFTLTEAGTESTTRWQAVNHGILDAAMSRLLADDQQRIADALPALELLIAQLNAGADEA